MFTLLRWIMEIVVALAMLRSVLQMISRVLRGGSAPAPSRPAAQPNPIRTGGDSSPSTLLHQDPVCGTYVPAGSSYRKIHKGRVYHFCSEACRDRYAG